MGKTTKESVLDFLAEKNPEAVVIHVSEESGGHLRFSQEPRSNGPSRVTCKPNGDITVCLEKTLGYAQVIQLISDAEGLLFEKFCAGESGRMQCATSGKIEGTPFSVQMMNIPESFGYRGVQLTDTYSGSDSLGGFSYVIDQVNGARYDPKIYNQGTSGGTVISGQCDPAVHSLSGSPRWLDHKHPALIQIPLDDKAPPPEDSIAWRLWQACEDIARGALESDYIQGIKNGTLDPNRYGQYTMQDAVYCYHAEQHYNVVQERAPAMDEPHLAAFAQARQESYQRYNQETFAAWHIVDPSAVALSPATKAYVDFESRTARDAPPIYSVVAMIPCNQLWAWLATQLAGSATPKNLYSFWIKENNDWGGAYRLDNFVDDWFKANPDAYDWDRALYTYRSCMIGELNFFRSACGQDPVPMP